MAQAAHELGRPNGFEQSRTAESSSTLRRSGRSLDGSMRGGRCSSGSRRGNTSAARDPVTAGPKMVLVIRSELRLTAGKIATQAAHGAVALARKIERDSPERFMEWWRTGQRKIVLEATDLGEMERLERAARVRGIPVAWVEDAGLTEVPPGTRTCLALGPAYDAEIDPVTGRLPLL